MLWVIWLVKLLAKIYESRQWQLILPLWDVQAMIFPLLGWEVTTDLLVKTNLPPWVLGDWSCILAHVTFNKEKWKSGAGTIRQAWGQTNSNGDVVFISTLLLLLNDKASSSGARSHGVKRSLPPFHTLLDSLELFCKDIECQSIKVQRKSAWMWHNASNGITALILEVDLLFRWAARLSKYAAIHCCCYSKPVNKRLSHDAQGLVNITIIQTARETSKTVFIVLSDLWGKTSTQSWA